MGRRDHRAPRSTGTLLSRYLHARRLQPPGDDDGRPAGGQRGFRQPAQLAGDEAAHRGRRAVQPRDRRSAVLRPRVRYPRLRGQARGPFPRRPGSRDDAGQPPLRQHGEDAPGGPRVDHHAGKLVGPRRGDLGPGRPGPQLGRRPLPRPGEPSPGSGVHRRGRGRRHLAAGTDEPVAHLCRQRGAHPRVPGRRRGGRGPRAPPGRRLRPPDPRLRRRGGRPHPGGEDARVLHVARQRHQRAAGQRRGRRRPVRRFRRGPRGPFANLEPPVGGLRHRGSQGRPGADHRPPAYQPHPPMLLAQHRGPRRRRAGARPQRRELSRSHLLGRALYLPVHQLADPGDHPVLADVPLPAAGRGARAGHGGRLQGRHVPLAERQRRHRGNPGGPPQSQVGQAGIRTSATISGTSTPPSSTTSGNTTG